MIFREHSNDSIVSNSFDTTLHSRTITALKTYNFQFLLLFINTSFSTYSCCRVLWKMEQTREKRHALVPVHVQLLNKIRIFLVVKIVIQTSDLKQNNCGPHAPTPSLMASRPVKSSNYTVFAVSKSSGLSGSYLMSFSPTSCLVSGCYPLSLSLKHNVQHIVRFILTL